MSSVIDQPGESIDVARASLRPGLIADLLRNTRESRGLLVREVAARAGTSAQAVSAYEHGARQPTVATLERLLAAMGRQLVLVTEPLHADIDRAIAESARQSVAERLRKLPFDIATIAEAFTELPYVVEGLSAAALHGAPVPVTRCSVAVPDDDAVLGRLRHQLRFARRWNPEWGYFGAAPMTPEAFRGPQPTRWEYLAAGELAIRVGALPESVVIVCDEAPVPVAVMEQVESNDPWSARVLARLRQQRGQATMAG